MDQSVRLAIDAPGGPAGLRIPGTRDGIRIRYRPVGHIPSNEDLLEFADHTFFGKPLSDEFDTLPYPEERDGSHGDASQ
jgi:hypothetical protein